MAWPKTPEKHTQVEELFGVRIVQEYLKLVEKGVFAIRITCNAGHAMAEKLSHCRDNFLSLDAGCGDGHHFTHVSSGKHIGIDSCAEFLQVARKRYPSAPLMRGDVCNLPFRTGAFDRVVSMYLFEHLRNLPQVLLELRRVLKSNGELMVGVPAEGGLFYTLGRWFFMGRRMKKLFNIDYSHFMKIEHCNTYNEIKEELSSHFNVREIRYLPFLIPNMHLNAVVILRCIKSAGRAAAQTRRNE